MISQDASLEVGGADRLAHKGLLGVCGEQDEYQRKPCEAGHSCLRTYFEPRSSGVLGTLKLCVFLVTPSFSSNPNVRGTSRRECLL